MKTPNPGHRPQVLFLIIFFVSIAVASAEPPKAIPISNPGFDAQVLAAGGSEQPIAGWENERPYDGDPAVVVYPSDGKGFVGPTNAQEGENVVLLPGTQLIRQVLPEVWKPNTTYQLTAHVTLAFSPGSSAMIGLAHGNAALTTAGSLEIQNVVASEGALPESEWQEVEVTFTTGKSDKFLGEPIVVFASNQIFDGGNNLFLDGCQLTSSPNTKRP